MNSYTVRDETTKMAPRGFHASWAELVGNCLPEEAQAPNGVWSTNCGEFRFDMVGNPKKHNPSISSMDDLKNGFTKCCYFFISKLNFGAMPIVTKLKSDCKNLGPNLVVWNDLLVWKLTLIFFWLLPLLVGCLGSLMCFSKQQRGDYFLRWWRKFQLKMFSHVMN